MIVFDTETTGLLKPEIVPLEQQPEIIEFAAVKLDDITLDQTDAVSFLVKPRILPLAPEIIKITGITSEMLAEQKTFATRVALLTNLFLGEKVLVAHNCDFDVQVLALELRRVARLLRFPWPAEHVDTVELTMDIEAERKKSARLKLSELYTALTGEAAPKAHRALVDVQTLATCVRLLRAKDGRI
jgi:DNA polymerase III epsilon subunit-like protein